MRYTLIVLSIIAAPPAMPAQHIAGVQLGVTTVAHVRQIRGTPVDAGRTVDGKHYYLSYADYTFYFTSDSIADFARYFPRSMLRPELEQLVGKPIKEMRDPNFQIRAVYSDTISAVIDRSGRNVVFVEYMRRVGRAGPGSVRMADPLADIIDQERGDAIPVLPAHELRLVMQVNWACTGQKEPALSLSDALSVVEKFTQTMLDSLASTVVKDSLRANARDVCGTALRRLITLTRPK